MSFEAQVQDELRNLKKHGRTFGADPKVLAEVQKRQLAGPQPQVVNNITLAKVGVLDRTVANIRTGKSSVPTSQLNPEQRQQLERARLNDEARAGSISSEQYQQKLSKINQNYEEETRQRSIDTARRAAPGLQAAAQKERERFANLGMTNFSAQEAAQTKQLQKVESEIAKIGIDPARLTQSAGRPNPRRDLKINTQKEIQQNQFAREQVFRTVSSARPKQREVSLSENLSFSDRTATSQLKPIIQASTKAEPKVLTRVTSEFGYVLPKPPLIKSYPRTVMLGEAYRPEPVKKMTRGEARAKGTGRMSDLEVLENAIGKVNKKSDTFRESQTIRRSPVGIVDYTPKPIIEKSRQVTEGTFYNPYGAAFVSGSKAIANSEVVKFFTPSEREQKPLRESKIGFRPSQKITSSNESQFIQENKQRLEGAFEEAKNIGIEILQSELKYGTGFVRTSSGRIAPATKEAKQIAKTLESNYTTDTFTQKLYEGKLGEINWGDPRTQGQALLFGASIVAPVGAPYAKQRAGQFLLKEAERYAVQRTENFLKEFGDFFGLEKLQPTQRVKIQPSLGQKTRSFLTRKPLKTDLGFKDVPIKDTASVYISSGGTAERPKPIYVLRGSAKKGFKEPTLEEITPTQKNELQTLLPKNINMRGGLSAFEQQELGVEATKRTLGQRRFIFTSKETPTIEQQRFYKEGVLGKSITEIGKGQEAPLEKILKGQVESYTKRGTQYKPSVYSETRAEQPMEKFIEKLGQPQTRQTKRPSTPFGFPKEKGELGGDAGKQLQKSFTKSEQDFIKKAVTPKPPTKTTQGPQTMRYFPSLAFEDFQNDYQGIKPKTGSKTAFDDIYKVIPKSKTGTSGAIVLGDFVKTSVIPKRSQSEFSILSDKLSFKVTPAQTPKQVPKQIPDEKFFFGDMIKTDVIPKQKQELIPKLDLPVKTQQSFFTPTQTRENIFTPSQGRFIFPPFVPSAFFGSGGFADPGSLKKGYAAYGISSDINIKTLPTYSRYSAGTGVFQAQAKEDKRIQELFYGKPKRKSKSKKKSGSKKKRKR